MDNLSRGEIGSICRELISAIDLKSTGRDNVLQRRATGNDNALLTTVDDCNINFHWWEQQFDILNHYRHKFPLMNNARAILSSPTLGRRYANLTPSTPLKPLERKRANTNAVSTENVASEERVSAMRSPTARDEPSSQQTLRPKKRRKIEVKCAAAYSLLPRFYYKPWPKLTHKVKFTDDEFRKYPELAAATLMNYRARQQSEDSIDLGLRIIAHLKQESSPLTIIPNMAIWRILENPDMVDITKDSVSSQLNVNDLRRAVCPYISLSPGLSKGFATMMLRNHHWYVVLLTEADKIVDCMVKTIESVSLECKTDPNNASSTMTAYEKGVDGMSFPCVKLAVMDSLGLQLEESGWESVKKYVFISLVQAVSTAVCTAPIQERFGGFSEKSASDQQVHFSCISYQVLMKVVWPSRYFVSGPQQFDGRTCAAFGLVSIWKLSTPIGYDEAHHLLSSQKRIKTSENSGAIGAKATLRSAKKTRKQAKSAQSDAKTVPFVRFQRFYDAELVHHVIAQLGLYIRKEVVSTDHNDQAVIID